MAKGKDFFFESILRENTLKSIFSGRRRKRTGVAEDVGDPIPQLSSFANCVVARCSRTFHTAIKSPDYLADKEFRQLTFDMMLAWESPGRLTLTTHALYFESLGVGYDKAVRYDLATDQRQVIKGDLTGPLGARLFDKAVMYKSISLAGPVYFGFPEFKGHSRRDYWLAVVREVLQVHKFIRKYYDLDEIQQMESLSKAMLGIFRYRALKEAFHIHPPRFRSILGFYLAEKLPKGDKILEAFYDYLKLPPDLHGGGCPLPFSLYTVAKMGFAPNMEAVVDGVEEKCILVGDVCVGSTSSSLETAVKESFCCSEIAEAARASVDQMKVDGIDTNLAVMK
ncbi:hypothetical protein GW17_00051659, partial [Ensete ventricosum]